MPIEPLALPEFWQLVILAIVQGVTEFLPVSSSGHLNVFASLLGGEPSLQVNVALHIGTLLSIVVFFWQRIWSLLGEDRRVIPLLIVGTLPAAAIGLTIKRFFPQILEDNLLTGVMLTITGLALMSFPHIRRGERNYIELGYRAVLLIGLFQAFALMPGISRSGFTILAGLLVGLKNRSAATFSFLLALPAIGGAGLLETYDAIRAGESEPWGHLVVAMAIAFVVGYASLALLIKLLDRGKLHWFAIWVLPLGMIVVIFELYRRLEAMVA